MFHIIINPVLFRIVAFAAVVVLNFWMLSRFLTFHFRRRRERTEAALQRRKIVERRVKGSSSAVRSESSDDGGDYELSEDSPRAVATSNSPRSQNNAAGRIRSKGNKSE